MNRSRACQITTEISLEKESSSYERDVKRAWKRFDQIFLKRTCNSLDRAIFAIFYQLSRQLKRNDDRGWNERFQPTSKYEHVRSQLKRISASLSIGKSIRGRGIGLKELKTEWSSFGKLTVILDLALTPQIGRLRPTVSLDALGHSSPFSLSLSASPSVSLRPRHRWLKE